MPIDASELRRVMGHFTTGVTIVTSVIDGLPCAMTANSITSVSLDPPLVLFCADTDSETLRGIRGSKCFAVNVLDDRAEHLSRSFATRGPKSFDGIGYRTAKTGAPVLEDVLAWLDCSVYAEHDAGDHVIVLGLIEDADARSDGSPLLFYRGGYHTIGS